MAIQCRTARFVGSDQEAKQGLAFVLLGLSMNLHESLPFVGDCRRRVQSVDETTIELRERC